MSFAVSIVQMSLAALFAVAGVAKLADRPGTREAIVAFGAPSWLAGPGATALPLAELLVAAALIPAATARGGALLALAMLVLFSAAILRALRAGSAPDCNCFGGLAQTEVGRGTLGRNAFLAALAAFVAAAGQSVSAFHWLTAAAVGDRPAILALLACLTALGCFCWALLRQNGRLLRRLEEAEQGSSPAADQVAPQPGTPAPGFDGQDLRGEPVSLGSLLARGLPVALFFTDPGCGACGLVLDTVAAAQREQAGDFTLAVISGGTIDRIERKATEFGLERVVPQGDESLFDAYGVRGFPTLVLIDAEGRIAGAPALGADPVRSALIGFGDSRARGSEMALR